MAVPERSALAAAGCALAVAGCAVPLPPQVFFDDFAQPDVAALMRDGWHVRTAAGHPGIEGAAWGPDTVTLVDDPQQPGNRLLRLAARTDGTPDGTAHAQVCHARKYFEGTYAARVRFSERPAEGPGGDVVVQTFYAVSPLRFDFDPEYSELDWEYLPNGGWGDARTRLYGVTWHTVSLHPWQAYNQPVQVFRPLGGWHVLVMQAGAGRTRFYLDGVQLDEHGGRNYPAVPMAISFNLWYSPGGLLPGTRARRVYEQDVDWVFHAKDRLLAPSDVQSAVAQLRRAGRTHVDTVPARDPPLASPCDM
jgi:hypothetical protein